jgi:hypothetical protein
MAASTAPKRAISGGALVLAVGAAITGMSASAHAAATPTPPPASDNTTAHVTVNSVLAIDVTPSDFWLDGAPGDSDNKTVTVNVRSNNATGFTLTLNAPDTLDMVPPGAGTIDIDELKRDGTALAPGEQAASVGSGSGPTPTLGTDFSHVYSIVIPPVAPGEYTGVLTYTATANPTP